MCRCGHIAINREYSRGLFCAINGWVKRELKGTKSNFLLQTPDLSLSLLCFVPLFSFLGPFELKYVALSPLFSVVPLCHPSAGKDECDSVSLEDLGLLQGCLRKNEEGRRKGQ